MTKSKSVRLALLAVLASVAMVVALLGGTASAAGKPIVIGWAFDGKGAMAPFDGPALAAASVRIKQINAKGGVSGRPLKIITCDTQGNVPAKAKSCAAKLLGEKAEIMFVTCDVDFATPVVTEAINRGVLATPRGSAHSPSRLADVEASRRTEIDLITGSLVREADRIGVAVPLHSTMYRLIKAKEASW